MRRVVVLAVLCLIVTGMFVIQAHSSITPTLCFDYNARLWTLQPHLQVNQPVVVEVKSCACLARVDFKFEDIDNYPNSSIRQALGSSTGGVNAQKAPAAYQYLSNPYNPQRDALRVRIEITPATDAPTESYEAVMPAYGRWVFDLSVGVIVTGLNDPKFAVKSVTQNGETVEQLAPQNTQDSFNTLYPTTLVHFFKTKSKDTLWAVTLGITPGDLQKFFVGPSLILGHGNRWIFSGGLAFGRVERLNDDLRTTQRVWRSSWFGGVSYRLLD